MAAFNQQLVDTRGRDVFERDQDDDGLAQRPASQWSDSAERLANLLRTIEGEVIPRLVLAHRNGAITPAAFSLPAALPSTSDVAEFAALAIDRDTTFLTTHVQQFRARGLPIEAVYLNLLAPAARHLGEMWDNDLCDFTAVTMALWRLQQVLRNLSSSFHGDAAATGEEHRALLASMPGEQHTFGLFIVAEFFRRAGWEVLDSPMRTREELLDVIRHEWFALAGLSVARATGFDELTSLIAEIRKASRNQKIKIMVGGPAFIDHPELIERVGADATASDGRNAVTLARDMLSIPLRSC